MTDSGTERDRERGGIEYEFLSALKKRLELALRARGLIKTDPDRQENEDGLTESA